MTLNKEEKSRSQLIYHLQGRSYRDLAKVTLSILATFTIFTCGNGTLSSDATSGWARWALALPEFGSSVNPITTRGADYAHPIAASPPGFEKLAASLQ